MSFLTLRNLRIAVVSSALMVSSAFAGPLFQVRGSVRQFFIITAPPGARAYLYNPQTGEVRTGLIDDLGGLIFRNLEPADGYIAAVAYQGEISFSPPTPVLSED